MQPNTVFFLRLFIVDLIIKYYIVNKYFFTCTIISLDLIIDCSIMQAYTDTVCVGYFGTNNS